MRDIKYNHETTHRLCSWQPNQIPQRPAQPKDSGHRWLRNSLFLPAFRWSGAPRRNCICRGLDCHARIHNSHHRAYKMVDQDDTGFIPRPRRRRSPHRSCRDVSKQLSIEFVTFAIRNVCLYLPNFPSAQPHTFWCRQSKFLPWADRTGWRRESPRRTVVR